MNRFVYLDNNATTKLNSEILERVMPYLQLQFGNPSSLYFHGKKVKEEIKQARENVASLIGSKPEQVVFTSGGSEANCAAINSALNLFSNKTKIITTCVEHASILEYCEIKKKKGCSVVYLSVDQNGMVDLKQLEQEIDENTAIVSIQYANNETGVILNCNELTDLISRKKQNYNFCYHIDCVQGLGKTEISVEDLQCDMASFSGHKIHALKGVGVLYVKEPNNFTPLIAGHQEDNLRGGTENVVGIVSMGYACKHLTQNLQSNLEKLKQLQQILETKLKEMGKLTINGNLVNRLPNTTSVTFNNHNGNELMFKLEKYGICVSTGSACNSESSKPSYVLTSMKIKNPQNTIRISYDEFTTNSQIDYFIEKLKEVL